jgi:beta-glucanase (GH16 family)
VIVSNAAGAVASRAATLAVDVVQTAPLITAQPADASVATGAAASFTVTATGTAPLHYQWSKDGAGVGADAAILAIAAAAAGDAGRYSVTVTNAAGSVASRAASLAVVAQGFTLTATAGAGGAIAPAGAVAVAQGASQTFAITPAAGQKIADVLVDGQSAGPVASYTFTAVQAAHSIAASFSAIPVGPGGDGVVWSDEFDGPSIDSSKWVFDLGNGPQNPGPLYGWGNGEMEYYTSAPDNAAIEDGKLVITARRQDWGGQPFTSARLATRGKYSFNKGRFVARIKMPEGNRMWPAFWLLGDRMEDWPFCGEIDIAEMFAGTQAGAWPASDYASFATAHWADAAGKHALDGKTYTLPTKLSADYHDYELGWDDKTLHGKIDGNEYWSLDITGADKSALRDHSYFIVLNLAVGSPNFGMTAAAQANGPLPQKMYVDYVRVYGAPGATVLDKAVAQPHGKFGIAADGTAADSQLDLAGDAHVYVWNNLVAASSTPLAGASSLAFKTVGSQWFGWGVGAASRHSLLGYAAGYLNFSMRTTSTDNFKVGISGGNDGDAWVDFKKGTDPAGFLRDGQWHKVSLPMTRFGNADFTDIRYYFMVAGADVVTPGVLWEFDEIYWSESAPENLVKPVGSTFCVFSERVCDAGSFTPGTDGDVLIWNTANGKGSSGTPSEGTTSFALSAPAAQWYGLGVTPAKLYDLSAFAQGHLHLSLKVPAATVTDFKLGLKSPGGQNVRESWLKFKKGLDPYGFVRDGQYHQLVIPAADLVNSDLKAVSLLFMLAGDGPAAIEFDDVYWTAQ